MFKQSLRQYFEKFFPNQELVRWFDPLHINLVEETRELRVNFPHPFFADWFKDKIQQDFELHASGFANGLTIVYDKALVREKSSSSFEGTIPSVFFSPAPIPESAKLSLPRNGEEKKPRAECLALLEECTFENFIINRKNDFPVAAAREYVSAWAVPPPYTPFVIYGHSGVGKSHLLMAMANAIQPNGKSLYYGDIEILESMNTAPGRFSTPSEHYVFIDDAQRVASSPTMSDALVALIDMFQSSGRILALVFDMHPGNCTGLGHKLQSRLTSGLVVEVKRPDLDIRRQFIQAKSQQDTLGFTKEQILNLAQRYQDIRGIKGALARLSAYRNFLPGEGGSDSAAVSSILDRGPGQSHLTPLSIVLTVARHYSVPPEEVTGKNRDKTVALARHIAILLCRELLGLSLVQTGRIFAGRDHSSVLYSIKKIKQLQLSNKDMHSKVEELRKLCLTRH